MVRSSAEQMRAWHGPALFSFGFRPFFLFGSLWAATAMAIWIMALTGVIELWSRFDPVSWHAHEFLFGYLGAVLAGFLLTAVPNWTGRLPMIGWRLAMLFGLWCAGRAAVLISTLLPAGVAVTIDLAFPVVLGLVILREIIAGQNWRNLIVLLLLSAFTLANALFHVEHMNGGVAAQSYALRLGLATAIMMISVIGGRIIPSFTRNWLARNNHLARPAPPMLIFDKGTLLASVVILAAWIARPEHLMTSLLLVLFGLAHAARLVRWQGHHTFGEPLVWILHLSYAFIPLGAFALAADNLIGMSSSAAPQHVWMAGAIGSMTLAVMSRASLGHTGQDLRANGATLAIYICLIASVLTRWLAGDIPQLIQLSAILWMAAFGGFALAYGPCLSRRKAKKNP